MAIGQQGRFVVLEGLDGAGTTTQADGLAQTLRARDLRVCATAEPSGGPLGAVARSYVQRNVSLDPTAAALAFLGDRADHLARVIRPALHRGEWVVCDRYMLSTLAYQGAEGVDGLWVLDVSRSFDIPDLTVFLDVPTTALAERISSRGGSERYESPDLQDALRDSYRSSIELLRERGHRIAVVDGSADAARVSEAVLAELDALP
jgi:dTMP kinase